MRLRANEKGDLAMNKQRKFLLGVVALGVAALLLDRVVLSDGATDPASAQAGAFTITTGEVASPARGAAVVKPVPVLTGSQADGPSISQRLHSARQNVSNIGARDAFTTDAAWAQSVEPETAADPVEVRPDVLREFESRHKLLAVMGTGASGMALIRNLADHNDSAMPIGGTIDGFELVSVTAGRNGRAAVFSSPHGFAILKLNDKE